MVIYKTIQDPSTGNGVTWQASQTEASKKRGELKRNGFKAETQTINVPTAKGPLIQWLNENVTA